MSVESMAHVLNHSAARGTAKLVLLGIANHDGDGGAWPSIATLARYANVTERAVQRAISDLVDAGEVVVHAQDGGTRNTRSDRRPNRYTITVQPRPNGVTPTSPRGLDGVTPLTPRGDAGDANGVTPASPEPSLNHPEPSKDSPSPATPAMTRADAADVIALAFDAFWDAYPRRVGKAAARKAFAKAARAGGPGRPQLGDIVEGARRMAADPNLPAKEFVPHPATWLNRGGWEDEPYPARGAQASTTDARVTDAAALAQRLAHSDHGAQVRAIGGGR